MLITDRKIRCNRHALAVYFDKMGTQSQMFLEKSGLLVQQTIVFMKNLSRNSFIMYYLSMLTTLPVIAIGVCNCNVPIIELFDDLCSSPIWNIYWMPLRYLQYELSS